MHIEKHQSNVVLCHYTFFEYQNLMLSSSQPTKYLEKSDKEVFIYEKFYEAATLLHTALLIPFVIAHSIETVTAYNLDNTSTRE